MPQHLPGSIGLTHPLSPENALGVLVLALALLTVCFGSRWVGWWELPLTHLARRKRLAVVVAAASPLLLRAALLPWLPVPSPRVHDEFSFLLGADTLAHGRLANPTHPFWVHFESIHTLARPTYASVFPPAQAAALAAGQVLFGHPWVGVFLSTGFLCGALCWMLQGWVPPRWALLGALLAVLRLGVSSYWMNSYWGGSVAAAGGALALGALPRMIQTPHWRNTTVMGLGLAILANSRPFEGAFLGLVVSVVLLSRSFAKQVLPRALFLRHTIILLAMLFATAAGLVYYFARVTGNPWLPPYVLYRSTMSMAPHFVWQQPRPAPLYNNAEMAFFYQHLEMHDYLLARGAPLRDIAAKAGDYWRFYLGPLFTIPLLSLPALWRDPKARQLLLMAAAFSLALLNPA